MFQELLEKRALFRKDLNKLVNEQLNLWGILAEEVLFKGRSSLTQISSSRRNSLRPSA